MSFFPLIGWLFLLCEKHLLKIILSRCKTLLTVSKVVFYNSLVIDIQISFLKKGINTTIIIIDISNIVSIFFIMTFSTKNPLVTLTSDLTPKSSCLAFTCKSHVQFRHLFLTYLGKIAIFLTFYFRYCVILNFFSYISIIQGR